jgi:Protein of unknown function (DUF3617)
MIRIAFVFALAAACGPAFAQGLEPGLWEFTNSMSMPGVPKPQANTTQRCITKEDAADPRKWYGQKAQQSECKVTMKNKSASSPAWELDCPKTGMRGTGSARIGRGTMESVQHMSGEMQGRKFEMDLKTTGKRLGACKS